MVFTELKNNNIEQLEQAIHSKWNKKDIFKAYDKPSNAKINVWNYWKDYVIENNCYNLVITGYNCFHFTIMFEDENYIYKITASNNYRYKK